MGMGVGCCEVVAVIGGDQGDPKLSMEVDQSSVCDELFLETIRLQFEKKSVRNKDFPKFLSDRGGAGRVAFSKEIRDFSGETAREGDQAIRMLSEKGFIDPGFVVEAIQIALADQFNEIAIARLILCQENEVIVVILWQCPIFDETAAGGHIHLTANNRFHPCSGGFGVKLDRAKEIPVVGDGDGRLIEPGDVC